MRGQKQGSSRALTLRGHLKVPGEGTERGPWHRSVHQGDGAQLGTGHSTCLAPRQERSFRSLQAKGELRAKYASHSPLLSRGAARQAQHSHRAQGWDLHGWPSGHLLRQGSLAGRDRNHDPIAQQQLRNGHMLQSRDKPLTSPGRAQAGQRVWQPACALHSGGTGPGSSRPAGPGCGPTTNHQRKPGSEFCGHHHPAAMGQQGPSRAAASV